MALPKTFVSGERLFASDLNGNFEDLDGRFATIDLEDLANVGGSPTDGQILEYDTGTSSWGPTTIALPAGIASNVVQAVKTDVFSTSSTSFTDVTGLSVTITPTTATSKVLLLGTINYSNPNNDQAGQSVRVLRDSTAIFRGDASSGRERGLSGMTSGISGGFQSNWGMYVAGLAYVDSPATTSATTYKIQTCARSTGTAYINRSGQDYSGRATRGASSIIAIEVAA